MINIVEMLKTICEKIIKLNNDYVSKNTFQEICDAKQLIVPIDETTGQTNNNVFYLCGHILRGYFSYNDTSFGAGNIANALVSSPVIPLDMSKEPFFKTINGNSFISGSTGPIASFNISDSDCFFSNQWEASNGTIYNNVSSYGVEITNTHSSSDKFNSYYYTTVNFNENYFNDKE
jgi:hypothetical protein